MRDHPSIERFVISLKLPQWFTSKNLIADLDEPHTSNNSKITLESSVPNRDDSPILVATKLDEILASQFARNVRICSKKLGLATDFNRAVPRPPSDRLESALLPRHFEHLVRVIPFLRPIGSGAYTRLSTSDAIRRIDRRFGNNP